VVWPAWGRSFAVSGKMPQRNTRRARGKPVSRLRETLAAVPRPCSAASYEFGRDGRRRKAETVAGRERPPRKRPSLARTGHSGRSLPGSFLAGRPCGPRACGGAHRRCPDGPASDAASEVSLTELVACKPIVFSSYVTSTISVSSNDPSYKAASLPSRRLPDVGAGDRVWQLRVP